MLFAFDLSSLYSSFLHLLKIGNYLNAGTARGNALGFKIDVLEKINAVKASNETKMSLTQYLVQFLEARIPGGKNLEELFPSLAEAARLSFSQLQESVASLGSKLTSIETEISHAAPDDAWAQQMSTFIGRAKMELKKSSETLDAVLRDVGSLMRKFALDPEIKNGETDPRVAFLAAFNRKISTFSAVLEY